MGYNWIEEVCIITRKVSILFVKFSSFFWRVLPKQSIGFVCSLVLFFGRFSLFISFYTVERYVSPVVCLARVVLPRPSLYIYMYNVHNIQRLCRHAVSLPLLLLLLLSFNSFVHVQSCSLTHSFPPSRALSNVLILGLRNFHHTHKDTFYIQIYTLSISIMTHNRKDDAVKTK